MKELTKDRLTSILTLAAICAAYVAFVLFCASNVHAHASDLVSLEVNKFQYNASDVYTSIYSNIPQFKLKVQPKKHWYLFASYENPIMTMVGQETFLIDLPGIGAGYKIGFGGKKHDRLKLSADVGYYHPIFNEAHAADEGMMLYMNAIVTIADRIWDTYIVEACGGPGLTVSASYDINSWLSITAGMRYLVLDYNLYGYDKAVGYNTGNPADGYWTLKRQADFGGYYVGITIRR